MMARKAIVRGLIMMHTIPETNHGVFSQYHPV
jgi:hypothetical protein